MRKPVGELLLVALGLVAILSGCSEFGGGVAGLESRTEGGFEAGPGDPAQVSPDGTEAILREDQVMSPVSLESPAFAVPQGAKVLSFDYVLTVPAENEDFLQVYVADASKPVFEAGGPPGRYAGSHRVDVTQFRGRTVRVIFSLMSGWADHGFDSELAVKNLRCGL